MRTKYILLAVLLSGIFSQTDSGKVVPLWFTTVIIGDSPLLGKDAISPAYDVAIDRARVLYPQVFQNYIYTKYYKPGNYSTCEESASDMLQLMGVIYNTSRREHEQEHHPRRVVTLSPGCSSEIALLGDICREWDFPLISTSGSGRTLLDDTRYPTVLATGPSPQYAVLETVLEFLKHFAWDVLSVIVDLMSRNSAFNTLLKLYDRGVRDYLANPTSYANTLVQNIDSTLGGSSNFAAELRNAAAHSCIILLITPVTEVYAKIMEQAISLQMNSGKFVFFIVRFNDLPRYRSTLREREDTLKNRTSALLPFVFEVGAALLNITGFANEYAVIGRRSQEHYNYTIPADFKFNTDQLSAYDSTLMLAEMLNEAYDQLDNFSSRDFIAKFRSRSFYRGLSATLSISNISNSRVLTTVVRIYNETDKSFTTTWTKTSGGSLVQINEYLNWDVQWKGQNFPPTSFPFCLQALSSGQDCAIPESTANSYLFFLWLAPVLALSAYIPLRKKAVQKDNRWWCLQYHEFDFDGLERCGCRPFRLELGGLSVEQKSLDGREVTYHHALYRGDVVQVVKFAWFTKFEDALKNKHILPLLQQIKALDHPNIGKFYGLAFAPATKLTPRQLAVVTESHKKGFLRDLIDSDNLAFNWALRMSVIWDIIRAVRYIHASPLKFHGALCFINLIVDEHFTLKITLTGTLHLYNSMTKKDGLPFPIAHIANLWRAPEVLDIEEENSCPPTSPTSAVDMFSLGVVLYEIATRNFPFDVDITDMEAIKEKLREIHQGRLNVDAYQMPDDTPLEMVQQIKKCWAFNPADRPKINDISKIFYRLLPNSNISVAEGILYRLENYNQELEATVRARKEALNAEMEKMDNLLANVLPKSIVQKLRNGEDLVPDFFRSVTVLFSDIPAFNKMVAECAPFSIVDLLHRLYSMMDNAISEHDVYKVETIKDSYMVASGLPVRNGDRHATEIAFVALKFLDRSRNIMSPAEYLAKSRTLRIRIGISTGPCVAAVIGQKQPRYCLVGDTVNTASRMEAHGEELKIHVTIFTKVLLDATNLFRIRERGVISIKGKGDMITYWLDSSLSSDETFRHQSHDTCRRS